MYWQNQAITSDAKLPGLQGPTLKTGSLVVQEGSCHVFLPGPPKSVRPQRPSEHLCSHFRLGQEYLVNSPTKRPPLPGQELVLQGTMYTHCAGLGGLRLCNSVHGVIGLNPFN